jgi:hypothetical protein
MLQATRFKLKNNRLIFSAAISSLGMAALLKNLWLAA